MRVPDEIKSQMEAVDKLVLRSFESTDGTEAMKFAQAAVNAADAINRKYLCISSNGGFVYAPSENEDVWDGER